MADMLRSVHFYRKVPRDLTEATMSGGTISLVASLVMSYLFCSQFLAYLAVDQTTSIVLDSSDEKKLQLNFNVTVHHLPCRYASLDIVDVMGTHLQNVSANILKTRINTHSNSVMGHAPAQAKEVKTSESFHKLSGNTGEPPKIAPDLDMAGFLEEVKKKKLVMLNFYAPWCPWSRRLSPVWDEAYANIIKQPYSGDVLMAKADCTAGGQELCQKQHIHAFPTVKIYRRHNPHSHESYVGDRTHEALETFVEKNVHDADHTEAVAEGDVELGAGRHEGCAAPHAARRTPHGPGHGPSGHAPPAAARSRSLWHAPRAIARPWPLWARPTGRRAAPLPWRAAPPSVVAAHGPARRPALPLRMPRVPSRLVFLPSHTHTHAHHRADAAAAAAAGASCAASCW